MSDHVPDRAAEPEVPPAQWPHRPPPAPPWVYPPGGAAPPPAPSPPPPPPIIHVGPPPPPPVLVPPIEWSSTTRTAAPPRPEPEAETLLGAVLVYVAGIALVVGAFLPWVVARGVEIDGWHATGDSHFLFGLGIGALVVATAVMGGSLLQASRVLVFCGAVVVAAVSVADIVSAGRVNALSSAHAGAGPWVTLVAALVLLAAVWLVRPAAAASGDEIRPPVPSGHPGAV